MKWITWETYNKMLDDIRGYIGRIRKSRNKSSSERDQVPSGADQPASFVQYSGCGYFLYGKSNMDMALQILRVP